MDVFFPAAIAADAAQPQQADPMSLFIWLAIFVGIFYFLIIRPQNKRQKEHQALVAAVEKGDEVLTSGGIIGRVARVDDQFLSLEVADGIELKVQRNAVTALLPKGSLKKV